MTKKTDDPTRQVTRAVARLQAGILAVVIGALFGIGLFVMTAWLIVKGGSQVGLHLQLLGNYFIGYSVTWTGAIVGLLWGAALGGVVGWIIGMVYNRVVGLRQR